MSLRVAPSKMNLIKFKRTLAFLRRAHDLLEEKRDILLLEVNRRIGEAAKLREELNRTLNEAYRLLDSAAAAVGSREIATAASIPAVSFELEAARRKVMGVPVFGFAIKDIKRSLTYGFSKPTILLDEAFQKFNQALLVAVRVAELENTLVSLVEEVKRTQRRINALEQFLIPKYSATVSMISNILEERDREEFVRVKKVKRILERRAEAKIDVR